MRKLARERLAQVFRVTARLVWGNGSLKLAELFNQTEVAQLFVCLAHLFYVLGERIHQIFLRVGFLLSLQSFSYEGHLKDVVRHKDE